MASETINYVNTLHRLLSQKVKKVLKEKGLQSDKPAWEMQPGLNDASNTPDTYGLPSLEEHGLFEEMKQVFRETSDEMEKLGFKRPFEVE